MIAYIPARKGSKRIKNKNILKIGKRPLIEIVVRKLNKLSFIKKIFVSTDCNSIKKISENSGAVCCDLRKKNLSGDKVTFMDLIKYDLPRYCEFANENNVLFTLATAILIKEKILNDAFKQFSNKKPDILMSCEENSHPIWWAMRKKKSGYLDPIFKNKLNKNSQFLEKTYIDSGMFYFFNLKKINKYESHKSAKKVLPFVLDFENRCDLNTLDDLKLLKYKFKDFKND